MGRPRLRLARWLAKRLYHTLEPLRHAKPEEYTRLITRLLGLPSKHWWPDPLDQVVRLDDRPGNAYLWRLKPDATDKDILDWQAKIHEAWVQLRGRPPRCLIFVVRDVAELRQLSTEEAEAYLKPWMEKAQQEEQPILITT